MFQTGSEKKRRTQVRPISKLLLGCSILLAAGGATAAPSESREGAQKQASMRYSIAGMSPGMSSSQIASAAGKAGYQLVSETKGEDWSEALRRAVRGNQFELNRPNNGIRDQTYRRGGERISVNYLPMPTGSIATLISYSAPVAVLSFEQAEQELTRRYGRKSFGPPAGAPWSMWCGKQAQNARECLNYARISLEASNSGVAISTDNPEIKAEQVRLFRRNSGAKASF